MLPTRTNEEDSILRRALRSSLHDILADVALGPRQPAAVSEPQRLGGGPQHAGLGAFASADTATVAAAAALPLQSSLLYANNLLSSAALAAEPETIATARSAFLQQQLIEQQRKELLFLEERKKLLYQESYMELLKRELMEKPKAVPAPAMSLSVLLASQGLTAAPEQPSASSVLERLPDASSILDRIPTTTQSSAKSLPSQAMSSLSVLLASQGIAPEQPASSVEGLPPAVQSSPKSPPSALEALGGSLRKKSDPYIDVSILEDPDPADSTVRRTRGGVSTPFPEKLHQMLMDAEKEGNSDIVSFFSHGRAFGVHDVDRFVEEIMPKYFKQSRWHSFARQLNLYGFIRITSGPDAGGYYHELFLKGRPNLSFHMRRVGVPQGRVDRRKQKSRQESNDPDFYSMKPLAPARK